MCRLRNIAMRDYRTDAQTDGQTPDKVIHMCRYAMLRKRHKKLLASLMRNNFPKRQSGAPLHTWSKAYDVPIGFVALPLV